MFKLSRFAMHEWKSDIKCQPITADHGVAITHGADARACSTSRDRAHTIASEDTNKLCDAVSLSLGLNSESDNYDMDQPSTSHAFTENVQEEDRCVRASETGESAPSSHFRSQKEGRRSVVTHSSDLFETLQRNRDTTHFGMATLQLTTSDMISNRQSYRALGPPQKRRLSVHGRSMEEADATPSTFDELLSANTRLHSAGEDTSDEWSSNPFTQNAGMVKTELEYSGQPGTSVRKNWDGAGKTANQPSRHCNVPSMNYSPYDIFLRNCNDYTLRTAPLTFNGYFPESYYSGGMYGRIPAPASLPRPCEWATGQNGLGLGFR